MQRIDNIGFTNVPDALSDAHIGPIDKRTGQVSDSDGIGDLSSTERGTARRLNGGKIKLEYIPMELLMHMCSFNQDLNDYQLPIYNLGSFIADFEKGETSAILLALKLIDLNSTTAVFSFGAKKYAAWNWAKGMPWSAVIASFKRHWVAAMQGEIIDPESGLSHEGHMGCNIVFLAHYIRYYPEGDDRPPKELISDQSHDPSE